MRADFVDIYTDGACSGNPGPGGWGAVLVYRGHEKEMRGGERRTTNNRMELTAAIRALEALNRPSRVRLHTDSTYLRDGITRWIARWKRNGWKTASRTPVKNADLWRRLDEAADGHDVEWCWVKGHSGHRGNERADRLAREGTAQGRGARAEPREPADAVKDRRKSSPRSKPRRRRLPPGSAR